MSEKIYIAKEVGKNYLMSNPFFQGIRMKLFSGRTTGALDLDQAFAHSYSILEQYETGLEEAGLGRKYYTEKSVIEIGPGANLGVELGLVLNGAQKANALDRFPDVQNTSKEFNLYEQWIRKCGVKKEDVTSMIQFGDDKVIFNPDKICYFGGTALENASARLKKEYDIAVSHLALEHVANLDKGLGAVSNILNKNGICVFICNLVSLGGVYRHEQEPLRLLYYSERIWNMMFSNRGGSNRARASHYKQFFEKHNFEVLHFTPLRIMEVNELERIKVNFHSDYRKLSNDDLAVLKFRIVARLKS